MRIFVLSLFMVLLVSTAFAQPATTAAATSRSSATIIPANDGKWHTVLTTTIKNPTADDDLFIDFSQVDTVRASVLTTSATPGLVSSGEAKLLARVLVDGVVAEPGPIVFNDQLQSLTSNLQTFLSLSCTQTTVPNVVVTTSCVCASGPSVISCAPPPAPPPGGSVRTCTTTSNPDPDVVTTCSLVPGANQTVATAFSETIGHSYDFLAPGVGGMGATHIVQVQEMLIQTTANGGAALALIGPVTLKIQAVNLK